MNKLFLSVSGFTAALFISFSLGIITEVALASSGACSSHSGVNCQAGADSDGSIICNDGWKKSSVSYSSMAMCKEVTLEKIENITPQAKKKDQWFIDENYGFKLQYKSYFNDVSDRFVVNEKILEIPGGADYYSTINMLATFCLEKDCNDLLTDVMEIEAYPNENGFSADLKSTLNVLPLIDKKAKISQKKIDKVRVIVTDFQTDLSTYIINYKFYLNHEEDIVSIVFRTADRKLYKSIGKDFAKMMKTFKRI